MGSDRFVRDVETWVCLRGRVHVAVAMNVNTTLVTVTVTRVHGDARARIPARTGDRRRATAIQHGHKTGAGDTQQRQRHEGACGRPDDAVRRAERRVTEQSAGLDHLTLAGRTVYHDDAVTEEQRQRDQGRHDEDDDTRR